MTPTTIKPHPERDGDSHLHPRAYHALAVLAGVIGLSASYVTVQLFALAIQATEQEGTARELLTLAAALFVAAELVAMFVAGLLPVHRLRALRWQLITCAVALVAFEAVSLYGARVVLIHATDAQANATQGRAEALRSRIEANRRNAATLLAAGEFSSRSILPSSRAEGARSIRDAAAMEADTARLATELEQVEAARAPTATAVFGETGVIALAVAQSLLISGICLLFVGAAGALARAARDARGTATPAAAAVATPAQPQRIATPQAQATPKGTTAAVPNWRRYALPASAVAAGAGAGLVAMAPAPSFAAPSYSAPLASVPTVTAQSQQPAMTVTAESQPKRAAPRKRVTVEVGSKLDSGVGEHDGHRYRRIRAAVVAGNLKPSVRALQAEEGGGTAIVRAYLQELEREGIVTRTGKGYKLV